MRIGSRRPTRYVLVPGPVIMPGLSPSTRPTSSDTVAVFGNSGSIQPTPASLSHAQITVLDVLPGPELGRGSAPDDLALLEDVVRVRDPCQRGEVFVDQQNRLPACLETRDAAPDLRPDEWREPLRRLVEDEQARVRHEGAPDREHLLLPAGERAAEDALTLGELGKEVEDRLDRPRVGAAAAVRRGRHEILAHREVRKDLAALRHEADPDLRDAVGRQPVDRPAQETDLAGLQPYDPHDGAHGGRLAHAVPAEERHHLARLDLEADAEEHLAHAVRRLDRLDREHQSAASSPR